MPLYVSKPMPVHALNFEEFLQHGRDQGANIVGGMPWSFSVNGRPVSHENDQRYLITMANGETLNMYPTNVLVTYEDGRMVIMDAAAFNAAHIKARV